MSNEQTENQVDVHSNKRKPGRPKKNVSGPAASWDYDAINNLLELRYKSMEREFSTARNNAMVNACWVSLSSLLSIKCNKEFNYRQCQDKLKLLKKRWSEIGAERIRTGNNVDSPITTFPYDELLYDYFSEIPGLQNTSYYSTDEIDSTNYDQSNEDTFDETVTDVTITQDSSNKTTVSRKKRNASDISDSDSSLYDAKRRRTQGECIENGMQSISNGLVKLGELIANKGDKPGGFTDIQKIIESNSELSATVSTNIDELSTKVSSGIEKMIESNEVLTAKIDKFINVMVSIFSSTHQSSNAVSFSQCDSSE